jgi:hypothetical protein
MELELLPIIGARVAIDAVRQLEAVFRSVNCKMLADSTRAAAEEGISARPIGNSELETIQQLL